MVDVNQRATMPNIPAIVEIFWEDHYGLDETWHEPKTKHHTRILSAIGYLVSQDERYYYVACTLDLETDNYQGGTAVLKKCVIYYNVVQLPRKVATIPTLIKNATKKISPPA